MYQMLTSCLTVLNSHQTEVSKFGIQKSSGRMNITGGRGETVGGGCVCNCLNQVIFEVMRVCYFISIVLHGTLSMYKSDLVWQTAGRKNEHEGNKQPYSSRRLWFMQDSTYRGKNSFCSKFWSYYLFYCKFFCAVTDCSSTFDCLCEDNC